MHGISLRTLEAMHSQQLKSHFVYIRESSEKLSIKVFICREFKLAWDQTRVAIVMSGCKTNGTNFLKSETLPPCERESNIFRPFLNMINDENSNYDDHFNMTHLASKRQYDDHHPPHHHHHHHHQQPCSSTLLLQKRPLSQFFRSQRHGTPIFFQTYHTEIILITMVILYGVRYF